MACFAPVKLKKKKKKFKITSALWLFCSASLWFTEEFSFCLDHSDRCIRNKVSQEKTKIHSGELLCVYSKKHTSHNFACRRCQKCKARLQHITTHQKWDTHGGQGGRWEGSLGIRKITPAFQIQTTTPRSPHRGTAAHVSFQRGEMRRNNENLVGHTAPFPLTL